MMRRAMLWNDIILIDLNQYYNKVKERKTMNSNRNGLCFCGSGKLQKNCHSNIYENSYAAQIIMNYGEIDKRIRFAQEQRGNKVICKKGCCDCCYDVFDIGIGEYFVLKAALIRRNNSDFEDFKTYAKSVIAKFKGNKEIQAVLNGDLAMYETGMSVRFVKCPFNGADGLCTEYQNRTSVCRVFGNTEHFGVCNKIRKAEKKLYRRLLKKDVLLKDFMEIDRYLMAYIQYLPVIKGGEILTDENGIPYVRQSPIEAHPLLYWLAYDEKTEAQYNDAVSMDVIEYCKKYAR